MNSDRGSYNPLYFFREAGISIHRHRVMSIASVIVLSSCLLILGVFFLLNANLQVNLESLQLLNEIVVFTDPALSQDEVDTIAVDIKAMDNVRYVEYTSKAAGLQKMRETYADYGDLFDEMIEKGDNPLPDSFTITYDDNSRVYELEYALRAIPGVEKVNNRADYAVKVEKFKKGMSAVFLWLLILLFAVSLFVIFNTIKLAVHGRKAEITVMRYIGATRAFIVAPFVIEGGIIGILSGVCSFFCVYGLYAYLLDKVAAELKMLTFLPFSGEMWLLLPVFAAIGILSGTLTSLISLNKSLKK